MLVYIKFKYLSVLYSYKVTGINVNKGGCQMRPTTAMTNKYVCVHILTCAHVQNLNLLQQKLLLV